MKKCLRLITILYILFVTSTILGMKSGEYRRRKIELQERAVRAQERSVRVSELDVLLRNWQQFILPEGDDTTNLCFAALVTADLHGLFMGRVAELPKDVRGKIRSFIAQRLSGRHQFTAYTQKELSAVCVELMRGFETMEQALERVDEPEGRGATSKEDEDV